MRNATRAGRNYVVATAAWVACAHVALIARHTVQRIGPNARPCLADIDLRTHVAVIARRAIVGIAYRHADGLAASA